MVTPSEIEAASRILGIPVGSNSDIVATAYRRAVLRHHPDAGGDADTFHTVHEAYLVLRAAATPNGNPPPLLGDPAPAQAYLQTAVPTGPTRGRIIDVAA